MKSVLRLVITTVTLALAACSSSKSLDFSQIYAGSNGPISPDVQFYESTDAVKSSWINSALTHDQLRDLLNELIAHAADGPAAIVDDPDVVGLSRVEITELC